ncbi:MAG: hypothetical protein CVU90_12145 [Firmicutes bacterium HGW-Firmicutes-15]|nr:MAG: hypothetical protein CVU90_12145 [Firmicutes bacterium HGW-Firmicutes-15]
MITDNGIKNEKKTWGWLLLAFFLMDSWWLGDSLVLWLTGRPVPFYLHAFLMAASFFLGLITATIFFKKSFAFNGSSRSTFLTLLCGTVTITAAITATPVVMKAWVYYLTGMIRDGNVNGYAASLSLLGLILLISIVAVFACFIAITFMIYSVPVHKTGKVAAALGVVGLKRYLTLLLLTMAAILGVILLLNVMKMLEVFLAGLLPYGFFSRYILSMVLAGGKTALAFFLIYSVRVLLAKDGDGIREKIEQPVSGSFIYPVAVAVLTVALIISNITPYLSGPKQLADNIQARIVRADNLRNLGQSGEASSEYIKARADLLAFQAYLRGISEITKIGELKEANELLSQAEEVYANSPFIPYFKGMLQRLADPQNGNSPDINKYFLAAAHNSDTIPEARIWTINGFRSAGEVNKANEALNLVIARGVFNDRFAGLDDANENELVVLLKETERIKALLNERELDVLLNRAEYENETSLLSEMLEYAGRNTNPEADYQVALLAEHIPYPAYMYEYAKKYFADRANENDGQKEIEAALFTSYMYVKSGHAGEAEVLIEAMYEKYPESKDIACDYAYTLLENQKPARAIEVIDAHKGEKDSCQLYLKAIASMENHDYNTALEAVGGLCLIMETPGSDPKVVRELDDYVYRFLLEYLNLCARESGEAENFLAELENRKDPAVLYHYVMGLNAKKAEDYERSNLHLKKLLEINSALAYPYYLLGVNYNEMAGYKKQDCYPLAEKYFLNFIDLRPDVVEGYFCLGSVYKHTGDLTRATRAFLRVADYNPYRDNPLYEPFGMYNHALDEIDRSREEGQR